MGMFAPLTQVKTRERRHPLPKEATFVPPLRSLVGEGLVNATFPPVGKTLVSDISARGASGFLLCWYRDLVVLLYSRFDIKAMSQGSNFGKYVTTTSFLASRYNVNNR
ncbi:hypothetical protein Pfo_007925 [Paulownia fortunei]|nr:hypothetical protein Pfo_007925 [Paulownia fortunei]